MINDYNRVGAEGLLWEARACADGRRFGTIHWRSNVPQRTLLLMPWAVHWLLARSVLPRIAGWGGRASQLAVVGHSDGKLDW